MVMTESVDNETIALPFGPSNLCFDRNEFMKNGFNVDQFIRHHRQDVALERLRDDLGLYLKILRSAMIELINKDYADFVNLSSNLVGLDRRITNLETPLGQLREEVMSVRKVLDEVLSTTQRRLDDLHAVREQKLFVLQLSGLQGGIEKIEAMLQTQETDEGEDLMERVAAEYNQLHYTISHCEEAELVKLLKPRVDVISNIVLQRLEATLLSGVESGSADTLARTLRIYAAIDEVRRAEDVFRTRVVAPYMNVVISPASLLDDPRNLKGVFERVLAFVPSRCDVIQEVTIGTRSSEVVRGYDILVNSVWPEIVEGLEMRLPSIFAPGNPAVFHEKYTTAMDFLDELEKIMGNRASILRLRQHPGYASFMKKWNLAVYFQIRYQDIAGSLEAHLDSAPTAADADTEISSPPHFHLKATEALWTSLNRCWSPDIFLSPLLHRFWKLSLQLLSRFSVWLTKLLEPQKEDSTQLELATLVLLHADVGSLCHHLGSFVDDRVVVVAHNLSSDVKLILVDALEEARSGLLTFLPCLKDLLVSLILTQSAPHVKTVTNTPRLFRRTNRDAPTKPSSYVTSMLQPINLFLADHAPALGQSEAAKLTMRILSDLAKQYLTATADVITSVQKMEESLRRLKKARGENRGSGEGGDSRTGLTDDDKIRRQLLLDVKSFGQEMETLGINKEDVAKFPELLSLVTEAAQV